MKFLCLIALLSVTLPCQGREDKVVTIFFSSGGKVFMGRWNKLEESVELYDFERNILSMTIYEGYLYVSLEFKRHNVVFLSEGAIWRVKLANSTSSGVDENSWKEFLVMKSRPFIRIVSMVGAHGFIFAGSDRGIIWRCSVKETGHCKRFNKFDEHKIVGLGYDPVDDKIYAALGVGNLRRCSSNGIHCDIFDFHVGEMYDIKIGFNALWLAVKEKWLVPGNTPEEISLKKCPISIMAADFNDKKCQSFGLYPAKQKEFKFGPLGASSTYLYYYNEAFKHFCRVGPKNGATLCLLLSNETPPVDRFVIA